MEGGAALHCARARRERPTPQARGSDRSPDRRRSRRAGGGGGGCGPHGLDDAGRGLAWCRGRAEAYAFFACAEAYPPWGGWGGGGHGKMCRVGVAGVGGPSVPVGAAWPGRVALAWGSFCACGRRLAWSSCPRVGVLPRGRGPLGLLELPSRRVSSSREGFTWPARVGLAWGFFLEGVIPFAWTRCPRVGFLSCLGDIPFCFRCCWAWWCTRLFIGFCVRDGVLRLWGC